MKTIKEYVMSLPNMGVNEWIAQIAKDGFAHMENAILKCADHFGKIDINHSVTFEKTVNYGTKSK